jgi:hypothetical protein
MPSVACAILGTYPHDWIWNCKTTSMNWPMTLGTQSSRFCDFARRLTGTTSILAGTDIMWHRIIIFLISADRVVRAPDSCSDNFLLSLMPHGIDAHS